MALTNKGYFKINDTEFAAQALQVNYESRLAANSGETDDGTSHIYFNAKSKRVVNITLPPSDTLTVASLLAMIQGNIYNLTFFDVRKNAEVTIECYTPSTAASLYSGILLGGLWQGVSFNANEVGAEQ